MQIEQGALTLEDLLVVIAFSLISWRAKKQHTISISSYEAEYKTFSFEL